MKNSSIITTILCSLIFLSCQKKDIDGFESSELKINISKPFETQVFKKGDTVFITGNSSYISQLHGYSLTIRNKASNEIYLNSDNHLHDTSININTFWVDTLSQNADLVLNFTVEADHDGHEGVKEINFKSEL